jgi:hypothetical protein
MSLNDLPVPDAHQDIWAVSLSVGDSREGSFEVSTWYPRYKSHVPFFKSYQILLKHVASVAIHTLSAKRRRRGTELKSTNGIGGYRLTQLRIISQYPMQNRRVCSLR